MNETHKRVIFEYQDWYARDFRCVPAGQEVWGKLRDLRVHRWRAIPLIRPARAGTRPNKAAVPGKSVAADDFSKFWTRVLVGSAAAVQCITY